MSFGSADADDQTKKVDFAGVKERVVALESEIEKIHSARSIRLAAVQHAPPLAATEAGDAQDFQWYPSNVAP